jgi:hypothetical protein
MKGKQKRQKIDKLFILGAGASYGASGTSGAYSQAPLDKDFCRKISELNFKRPSWPHESADLLLRQWKDFGSFEDSGLEAAVLKQLGHLEFIRAIHKRKTKNTVDQAEYLNHLAHLICFVLKKAKPNRNNPYKRLFDYAFAGQKADNIKNRVITFNYDDLLDKHFIEEFGVKATYFDRLKVRKDESDKRKEADRFNFPFLLKLHGSVNWLCETSEFEKLINKEKKEKNEEEEQPYKINSIWHSKSKIPLPSDSESPLVIPPLPIKPITEIEIFSWLWTRAYEYLHEAKELVVCGYSLPDTDRMAVSLFSNFKNNNLKRITVVDCDPHVLNKWRVLLRRKGISNAQWGYCETFEEYTEIISQQDSGGNALRRATL